MDPIFRLESFDSLHVSWQNLHNEVHNSPLFMSPSWSRAWWQHFGSGAKLFLGSVRHERRVIGIAPLLVRDNVASFIGSEDICDYMDFIVAPKKEEVFFKAMLDSLVEEGIEQIDLASLRPDSTAVTFLVDFAPKHGWQVQYSQNDVSVLLNLPATWETYIQLLDAKQRHELKRKLRRLSEEGEVNYRITTENNTDDFNVFLRLFRDCRDDKAAFLTAKMEAFFRSIANTMAEQKLLRLGILELDESPVAATLCFNYKNDMYLYNSGYAREYSQLSVGVISKVLCIKDCIQRKNKIFDFLKGGEKYKYHLGGYDLPLFNCSLKLLA